MQNYLQKLKSINTIEDAINLLKENITFSNIIQETLEFAINAHKNQKRKSGEPYIVHPILVAAITAKVSNDEAMVLAALLHDVVEDTQYSLQTIQHKFGNDVAHIVDGLTKITEIRENEFTASKLDDKMVKSALTFRKMLIASIDDVRVLVVKLCDRVHNMLTLSALPKEKQKRISEETLVVYAPIAHRLGMSMLKNQLEDLSFYYLYPKEYEKIDNYITTYQEKIQHTFEKFLTDLKTVLEEFNTKELEIFSRIKHYYSIYLKMQRKGISIEEVLDLFAVRIIVNNTLDCYKVLGYIHTNYKPLVSRFKDYIAIPKENGYQTIHTTVFSNRKIFELQIRTKQMHHIAEYGVAAHWIYKDGNQSSLQEPNLKWLHSLEVENDNIEEFYLDTKQELFSEDIVVFSPKGDIFTLPRDSIAYDFAYLIHTDLGNKAIGAYINTEKRSLLTQLKSGDIISIEKSDEILPRCSWYNMVKTTKAKKNIKIICLNRLKQIDLLNGINIINTIFSRYIENVLILKSYDNIDKVNQNLDQLKQIKRDIEKNILNNQGIIARLKVQNLKFKEYKFDNLLIYSNFTISSVNFDHCCHPKNGDDIVAFKEGKDVIVHHKMCENTYKMMQQNKQMVFCKWSDDKYYTYKMVVSLQNKKGELAKLLTHLSKHNAIVLSVDYGRDQSSHIQYCTISLEIQNKKSEKVRQLVSQKAKIVEFYAGDDAYK